MQVYAVLGRPGTEAGLFARLLANRLRATTVALPPCAAAEIAHRTHLGGELQRHAATAAEGSLLPSSLVAPLILPRLQRAAQQGAGTLVLSGFPRTVDQERMLQMAGVRVPTVLNMVLDYDEARRRLDDRQVCESCGEPMYPLPPVEGAPGGLLSHLVEGDCESPKPRRLAYDQAPVDTRLRAFEEFTAPLLERLRAGSAAAVHDIPVGQRSEETWAHILSACGLPPDESEQSEQSEQSEV